MENLIKMGKSVFAFALAAAIIATSMFTGVSVFDFKADAACATGEVDLLEFGDYLTEAGSTSKYWDSNVADNGETGTAEDPIIIDSAEEFVYLAKASGDDTAGKYYKVADGIAAFDLSKGDLDFNGTLADNLDKIQSSGKNHSGGTPGFQGHFDGNGVTVYGAWTNHYEGNVSNYAGLFSCTKGNVTIKNVNVKFASFTGKYAVGGIVGYHKGDGYNTLTVENCSITESKLVYAGTGGFGHGIGAMVGYSANLSSYKNDDGYTTYVNGPTIIKNCYVNLNEENFVSIFEPGMTDIRGVHGGIVGAINSNALQVSDCVVIGITPYATQTFTGVNDVQHSGLETHFINVYTTSDVAITNVNLGGTGSLGLRDFTGRVYQLTDDQMKGAVAVANMSLDWSVWMPDTKGYPELRANHKNISVIDNYNGTHSELCECGFGGVVVEHNFVDDVCDCGASIYDIGCKSRKTIYWNGDVATGIATGAGTKEDPFIIKLASEFAWLIKQKADVTAGKYYKIDDTIGTIVLQPETYAEHIMALDSAEAVKEYFKANAANMKTWTIVGWEQSCFAGNFDGNGVTVYGLYQASTTNAGLFSTVDGGAVIKNIALKNSYLTSSSTNYQVGGIAAVTSGANYGAQTNGFIWFDSCVVANNYMHNYSSSHDRSAVIIGGSSDVVYMDNCLIYGNDATYGNGVKMPVWSSANNSVLVSSNPSIPDGLTVVDDGAETPRYSNMIRNSIIFGAIPYDLAQMKGSRFNEPNCYQNVLTDADVATDTFANGTVLGATEDQIKTVTIEDLAVIELGDAWLATDSLPTLKVFHAFKATDNYDGTHSLACDCGFKSLGEQHIYVDNNCEICGAYCAHLNLGEPISENFIEPTCTTHGSYDDVIYCADCGTEVSRKTVTTEGYLHHIKVGSVEYADACESVNDEIYPFKKDGDLYTSTNKVDGTSSTFTFNALYDCTLVIGYTVSSESNYDKLIIMKNGSALDSISGEVAGKTLELDLFVGDTVTITYSKDGSVSNGSDEGYFAFVCEQVQVGFEEIIPEYEYTATCEGASCYYCGKVLFEATGHNISEAVEENRVEPTCTTNGYYYLVTYCNDCGVEVSRKKVTIVSSGHTESNKVIENVRHLTCTQNDSYDRVVYCTICDCELSRETIVNKYATGHDFENNVCNVCGESRFTGPTIVVNSASGVAGDTVDVKISLENNPGIASALLRITYDDDVLELVDKTPGASYAKMAYGPMNYIPFAVNWVDSFTPNVTSSDFVTLTFKIKYDAPLGDSAITVTYDQNDVFDSEYSDVVFAIENGVVNVLSCKHENTTESIDNEKELTCTQDESYEKVVKCDDCGIEISRETVLVKAAKGHKWGDDHKCTVCGESRFTGPTIVVNSASGVAGDTVDVKISLENNPGIVSAKLSIAYDSAVLELVKKTAGASYATMANGPLTANPFVVNWVDGINPNVTAADFVTLTFKIKDGAAIGETPITVTYKQVDVFDYDYNDVVFAIENGVVEVVYCEHEDTISALENEVHPTCTEGGSYDVVVFCDECGEELSRETVILDPYGHSEGYCRTENVVEATCTTDGSYDYVVLCGACDIELSRERVIVDAIGHNYTTNGYSYVEQESTCSTHGKRVDEFACIECGDSYSVYVELPLEPDEHTYDNDYDNICNGCQYARFVYGDVNGDDRINNRDLALLMQWLNGWDVVILLDAADVYLDGKINNRDYGLLMLYVIGDIYYIGY